MPPNHQIWIYAADIANKNAAVFLANRLQLVVNKRVHLVTSDGTYPSRNDLSTIDLHPELTTPQDLVLQVQSMDDVALIWIGPTHFEHITRFTNASENLFILCNLTASDVPQKRLGLFSTHVEKILRQADFFFTKDPTAAERLAKLNIDSEKIITRGALQKAGAAPTILGDGEEFAILKGRAQWTAIEVSKTELMSVLLAHKAVLRESHRMLLLLAPADPKDEEIFKSTIDEMGFRVARRLDDEIPDNNTAIFLADGPDEFARWLSMAPVAFLGQSLLPELRGTDPMPAASLGVAVLYGPHIASYLDDYSQLAHAGAARIVRDADSLATAVLQVSNPQLAAQMGLAAWDLVSSGAEATDAVIGCIQNWIAREEE